MAVLSVAVENEIMKRAVFGYSPFCVSLFTYRRLAMSAYRRDFLARETVALSVPSAAAAAFPCFI